MSADLENEEHTASQFLRNLAERLMQVPAKFGVDGCDIDQLVALAAKLPADMRIYDENC